MSSSASSCPAMWSFSRVASIVGDHWKCSRMRSSVQPRALSRTLTGWRGLGGVGDAAGAVLVPAEGLEQDADRLAALAVDPDADGVALVDVELQPGTAAGDDLG